MLTVFVLSMLSGLSIPLGASISSSVHLRSFCTENRIDSFVSAFGGGALLAAISLVLVPFGIENSTVFLTVISFLTGGIVFWQISNSLSKIGTSASQFSGMLLDFIPESIVLGASAATGSGTGYLLAILIVLQNMPEGFASYYEISSSGVSKTRIITLFTVAPFLGPASAFAGYAFLSTNNQILSFLMLFCSGGIIYLIFESIAPGAKIRRYHFPAIGAVIGFLLGILGAMIIH